MESVMRALYVREWEPGICLSEYNLWHEGDAATAKCSSKALCFDIIEIDQIFLEKT